MSWEWVALISVFMVCGVVAKLFHKPNSKDMAPDLVALREQLDALRMDQLVQHKINEETKKFISQANMAQGLRAQR